MSYQICITLTPEEEADKYIDELKKKGIRIYKLADSSPEELEQELFVSREVAQRIIARAKEEVLKKMKKKGSGKSLQMLPHIGKKRAEILREKKLTIAKLSRMSPEELMKEIPHLRRYEAEDIILAAELLQEEKERGRESEKAILMSLPYMNISRQRTLRENGVDMEKLARMKPEELMALLPGLRREHAERMIIAAELNRENRNRKRSLKAPRPQLKRKVSHITPRELPRPGMMRRGLVNGNSLVNGRGIVNGMGVRRAEQKSSKLPVFLIIFIVMLSALMPMLFFTGNEGIVIDGKFGDWSTVPGAYDPFGIKDGALVEGKGVYSQGTLYIFAKLSAPLFSEPEGLYIFIDGDGNNRTGYRVGNLGADYMVKIYGWNNTVHGRECYIYQGKAQDNWSAFESYRSVNVAYSGTMLELSVVLPSTGHPSFIIIEKNAEREDNLKVPITPAGYGAYVLVKNTVDRITGYGYQSTEKLEIFPYRDANFNLTLVPFGNYSNVNYSVRIVNEDGKLMGTNTVHISTSRNLTLTVQVKAKGTGTIGFRAVADTPHVNVENMVESVMVGNPSGLSVDGNFDDWQRIGGVRDPQWDVQPYSKFVHENIDLKEIKRAGKYFYIQTYGNILAGNAVPEIIERTVPDSDRDTVPDYLDPYPHDFNNDGIPDNESYVVVDGKKLPDVDGDGIPDYPYGPDMWLNTTIPSWFPKPYAGRHVSVYIGPIPKIQVTGNDTFLIFIKSKNGSYHAPFLPFSSSYRVIISGRGFHASARLQEYDEGRWINKTRVKIAFAGTQLEGDSLVNGGIFVLSVDWLKQHDMCDETESGTLTVKKANFTAPQTRAAAPLIVDGSQNDSSNPYYLGIANGTTTFYNFTYVDIINNAYVVVRGKVIINITGSDPSTGRSFYIDSTSVMTANGTGYAGGAGGDSTTYTGGNGDGSGGGGGGEPSRYRSYTLPIGAGGGGGGYGGSGGDGGDTNLPNGYRNGKGGSGGSIYGTETGADIDMGSGGGGGGGDTTASASTSHDGYGGNGGGSIVIYAQNVTIDGKIYANGENGWDSVYGGGGGGGSGGGILILAGNVTVNGLLAADGGNGGSSSDGGAGGGGGGGRIKIFYSNSYINNGIIEANGGISGSEGIYGNSGIPGDSGSTYSAKVPEFSSLLPVTLILPAAMMMRSHNRNSGKKLAWNKKARHDGKSKDI